MERPNVDLCQKPRNRIRPLGAGGTACLYKGTFGFESFSPYANNKLSQEMSARNKRRLLMQRLGLGLLLLSFLLGVAHVFVE
jgi:hypothetical protein